MYSMRLDTLLNLDNHDVVIPETPNNSLEYLWLKLGFSGLTNE